MSRRLHSVEKLLAIAGPAILDSAPTSLRMPNCDSQLRDLFAQRNGFYAFESALHVLADGEPAHERGLQQWNSDLLWRSAYAGLPSEAVFFAEDIFGAQFALIEGSVSTFDPETGDFAPMAATLDEWASKILDDYRFWTGHPVAHEWQTTHGALAAGHRLVPVVPFVLGGAFSVDNVRSLDAVKGMRFRASIAEQIRDLPDGAKVTLERVD